jgi:hypothetical protein
MTRRLGNIVLTLDWLHPRAVPRGGDARELLGPSGRPIRDEQAHEAFRREQLNKAPRVVWEMPQVDRIEHRDVPLEDVMATVKEDKNHPISLEVVRIMGLYKKNLEETFVRLERTFPKGDVPQLAITRKPPRYPIEHVAQHLFAAMVQEVIVDVTEEAPLLHPAGKA